MFAAKKTNISTVLNGIRAEGYAEGLIELTGKLLGKEDVITDPSIRWWLSSGVWPLDLMISRGNGIPAGKVIEIFGPPRTGKTTLCLEICKQAQLAGGRAEWIDFEAAMSNKLSKEMVGISTDPTKWAYKQPLTAEKIFTYLEALIRFHGERSEAPLVIVIDSIPAAVALGERDKSMSDSAKVGELALTLSRFLPRIVGPLARANCYFLMINQLRTKFSAVKGQASNQGPVQAPAGGLAPEFYSHLRFDLRVQEIQQEGGSAIGSLVRCKIDKSRIDTPFRDCLYPIYFRDDQYKQAIDDGMACLIYAISRNALPNIKGNHGTGWHAYQGKNYRKEDLHPMYYEDAIFRNWLRELVKTIFEKEHRITIGAGAPPVTQGGLPYDPNTGEVLDPADSIRQALEKGLSGAQEALQGALTTISGGASMLVPAQPPEPPPVASEVPTNPQTTPEIPKVTPASKNKGGRPKGSTNKPKPEA